MTGGGSGGHITPLLSLAHALKKAAPGNRVIYIGQQGEQLATHLEKRFEVFDEAHYIPAGKFRRYHGESVLAHLVDFRTITMNARDLFRTLSGIGYARKLLKKIRPDVVFCKGGFVGVPVGIAAYLQKIPLVTHDSDTVPGLANRIVGRFAQFHATGMPARFYKYPEGSVKYVGIPLDERIKPVTPSLQAHYKKQLKIPSSSLVVLVGGAGMGSRDINNSILTIAPELIKQFSKLHIIHIAGQAHEIDVAKKYRAVLRAQSQKVRVLGFTPDFYRYTGAADLVISRAGATTIAELGAQKKALIAIPAPHLTGGHQLKNAEELEKHQAALVIPNDATADELLGVVANLLEHATSRRRLAEKLGKLAKTDAADELARILTKVASK